MSWRGFPVPGIIDNKFSAIYSKGMVSFIIRPASIQSTSKRVIFLKNNLVGGLHRLILIFHSNLFPLTNNIYFSNRLLRNSSITPGSHYQPAEVCPVNFTYMPHHDGV